MDRGDTSMARGDTGMAGMNRPAAADTSMAGMGQRAGGDTAMAGMPMPAPKPDAGLDAPTAARVRATVADTARLRAVVADSAATRRLIAQIRRLPEPERARALAAVRAAQERAKPPEHGEHRP